MFMHLQHCFGCLQLWSKKACHDIVSDMSPNSVSTLGVLTAGVKAGGRSWPTKRFVPILVRGILAETVPLESPCAFRLRRLAQNACPGLGLRHFHFKWKFLHNRSLLRCPCAFRLHRLAQHGCPRHGLRHFYCKFARKQSLLRCPCACQLRRLAQYLQQSGCSICSAAFLL